MSRADTLDTLMRDEVRRHRSGAGGFCTECDNLWPCAVVRLREALDEAEQRAAALEAALSETMARYLAARDLIAQYDAIWSQPVDRDWDEQTEAGRAAYRALAPDAIARALADAAPATREE